LFSAGKKQVLVCQKSTGIPSVEPIRIVFYGCLGPEL
jgi:hypothetical protein